MEEDKTISTTLTCYALSIKGGYYDCEGNITEELSEALLFNTRDQAIAYRKQADKYHQVEQSMLLRITWLVEDCCDD